MVTIRHLSNISCNCSFSRFCLVPVLSDSAVIRGSEQEVHEVVIAIVVCVSCSGSPAQCWSSSARLNSAWQIP